MSKKSKRNILFWAKVLAIFVAAVFMVIGVGEIFSDARTDKEAETEESTTVEQNAADTMTGNEAVIITQPETITKEEPEKEESLIQSMDWDGEESYLLAKIAMAEAEGESIEGKALVILVVLNRVWSNQFPDTIEEVILQEYKGVHQFSVTMDGGRWWRVEPNEECYEALDLVMSGWNESRNALYFESPSESTWHQEHLDFLFKYGNHYFYRDKE
ncbi:MAG: cell wall hydrolase [Clostridium sp.]|nr:cell wall hydrolase [Clostridium sp.]